MHKQGGDVLDWYLLAMIQEHLGQHDKALQALQRAEAIREVLQKQSQATNWDVRLAVRLLRQEAQAVVKGA